MSTSVRFQVKREILDQRKKAEKILDQNHNLVTMIFMNTAEKTQNVIKV